MPISRVLRTKITPPPKGPRTLVRPRVTQALLDSLQHRLTLVQAGAGYGKSTALAVLAEEVQPVIWYQASEQDSDPLVFLLHLCHAAQRALPDLDGLPTHWLESWDGASGRWPLAHSVDQFLDALDEYLHSDGLLVLDDAHLLAPSPEMALILDRLVGLAPHSLHVLLAGRPPLSLPSLPRWRTQGEVLTIDQSVLAFDAGEISALFSRQYGYELAVEEVEALLNQTEGWAIALQLIWQGLRSGSSASVEQALANGAGSQEALFEILAREVFEGQPADVQQFLLVTATLRELTPQACDALCAPPSGSAAMLAYLRRQELFVVDAGDGGLRYHHIFHHFLQQGASQVQRREWHRAAAAYFEGLNDQETAIYHRLQAEEHERAAVLLDSYGARLLAVGRLDSLANSLDALPPPVLQQHPPLLSYLGDLARLHSRFQEALGWYQQAEAVWRERSQMEGVARALRGQARVYLDTVNPSRAEALLQQSIRITDGIEGRNAQARLYELLAENKLNAGRAAEAEQLRLQAEALRSEGPSDEQLWFRVLLRTGRLEQARRALEERAEAERREPVHTPRAHRETLLLLSLIYALEGSAEAAYQAAVQGTQRGVDLQSPFVTAVGHTRQGHALMLLSGPPSRPERHAMARRQFEETIHISRKLAVPRLLVETYWGMCRAAGYQGDLAEATQMAQEAIDIAAQAGDEWIASLVRLTMGASLTLASRFEAAEAWLEPAVQGFLECSDPFGRTAARLWLCLGLFWQKNEMRLGQLLPEVLSTCREYGYDFLFTRPTLLGPPDERMLVPLLRLAQQRGWEAAHAARLLEGLGLGGVCFHPGYQLRVTTLGSFQVLRGEQPVPNNGWRRDKARQLFQLLLTFRDIPLDRDQIIEHLWPQQDPATAQRNFKVTLNTLYQVLEPDREPGRESAYIVREGSVYSLRPEADVWLDAREFVQRVETAQALLAEQPEAAAAELQRAADLYGGEFLPEARYETWAAAEREHLAVMFLRAADLLSELHLQNGRVEEAIQLGQRILACDNCWERAYRHLMLAFDRLGDHGQVARTYQRCVQALHQELDVSPAAETQALYQALVQDR